MSSQRPLGCSSMSSASRSFPTVDLVLVGVHAAADAGAHVIEYEPHGERLHLHGRLPWQQEGGRLRLHAADVS